MKKTGKPIFNSFLAKQLVLRGNVIIDIQPNKRIENSVIFYFKDDEKFYRDLEILKSE